MKKIKVINNQPILRNPKTGTWYRKGEEIKEPNDIILQIAKVHPETFSIIEEIEKEVVKEVKKEIKKEIKEEVKKYEVKEKQVNNKKETVVEDKKWENKKTNKRGRSKKSVSKGDENENK